MAMRWYVVQAYSGFEQQVRRSLLERISRAGIYDRFGQILVPTEEVVEMRDGQKRKSDRKFFPGYVLVQMELDNETWHTVRETPKVLGFIGGTSDKPAPISEKEAQAILQRIQDGVDKPKPKVLYEPGEMVRVTDGPFNDFEGVVEEVNYEKSRLRVGVMIFGRTTPVELEFSHPPHPAVHSGSRKAFAPDRSIHGQESYCLRQVASCRRQGESQSASRSGTGPARRQHHGILQDLQRPDATSGAGSADSGGDHGLQRPQFHLYYEDPASFRAAAEGARFAQGQFQPQHQEDRHRHPRATRRRGQGENA